MGNKRNKRSRRLETSSPDRGLSKTEIETPNHGNVTLTNVYTDVQETLICDEMRPQFVELVKFVEQSNNNEIQAWT